jgi:hypothetical protein
VCSAFWLKFSLNKNYLAFTKSTVVCPDAVNVFGITYGTQKQGFGCPIGHTTYKVLLVITD